MLLNAVPVQDKHVACRARGTGGVDEDPPAGIGRFACILAITSQLRYLTMLSLPIINGMSQCKVARNLTTVEALDVSALGFYRICTPEPGS